MRGIVSDFMRSVSNQELGKVKAESKAKARIVNELKIAKVEVEEELEKELERTKSGWTVIREDDLKEVQRLL